MAVVDIVQEQRRTRACCGGPQTSHIQHLAICLGLKRKWPKHTEFKLNATYKKLHTRGWWKCTNGI